MTDKERLLTREERTVLQKLALEPGVEGKRAVIMKSMTSLYGTCKKVK